MPAGGFVRVLRVKQKEENLFIMLVVHNIFVFNLENTVSPQTSRVTRRSEQSKIWTQEDYADFRLPSTALES